MTEIGRELARLEDVIAARRGADPASSWTAKLLHDGPARCAKKFGEEAVEAALAGALEDRDELTAEAADVLYHLAVLLAANDVRFDEVAQVLARRSAQSGIDEKKSRSGDGQSG